MFGESIILLWNAMMLKKRVVVVCSKLNLLLRCIRSIPLFVWHRQAWDTMRPFVTLNDSELLDLKNAGVYVAGFVDQEIKDREELYDLLVDCKCVLGKKKNGNFLTYHSFCDFFLS
jgi:hypothetical protein